MNKNATNNNDFIAKIIQVHERLFYKMAYTYMRNHEDAQDVLHNAYEKAYAKQSQIKNKNKTKNWILTIIRNEANSIIKRNVLGREKELKEYQLNHKVDYSENIAMKVDMKIALGKLTKEQRDLVIMKYLLGYKQREIGLMLKMPTGTVKSKTSRALDALREILGGDFNE